MNLSAQKIDIYDQIDRMKMKISDLKIKIAILKEGVEAIERGESMIDGKGVLAAEVKRIMQQEVGND